ncbi:hypothetical protein D9M68_855550 [compost metagenome]
MSAVADVHEFGPDGGNDVVARREPGVVERLFPRIEDAHFRNDLDRREPWSGKPHLIDDGEHFGVDFLVHSAGLWRVGGWEYAASDPGPVPRRGTQAPAVANPRSF